MVGWVSKKALCGYTYIYYIYCGELLQSVKYWLVGW
jgi:hypothetical protein